MTQINSQRGVPYDPAASVRQREREALRKTRELSAEVEKQIESLSPRKQHARMLDQVEHAWKERARDRDRS
jgi:hypothetical protein